MKVPAGDHRGKFMHDKQTEQVTDPQLKKANVRLALTLGAVAILVMVYTMFSLVGRV